MTITRAKSRQIPVYSPDGRLSNIKFAKGKCGVYMIYISGELRYVGYSGTQLESTILRHFQSWEDRTQVRVSYGNHDRRNATVRITLCKHPEQARRLESALLIKYKPVDNPAKLSRLMTPAETQEIVTWDDMPALPAKVMEEAPF